MNMNSITFVISLISLAISTYALITVLRNK